MLRAQVLEVLKNALPMLLIFTVVISSIRIVYLKVNREKFILYKEFFALLFMIYILILFYVVTYQDPISSYIGTYNLMPFKEMFRYHIGTPLFYKNIIGNLIIFMPFGLFVSSYLKTKKFSIILILAIISSLTIEFAQRLIIGRVFDVDDIILNVVGSIIGYLVYLLFDAISKIVPRVFKKDWFINMLLIVAVIGVIIYFTKLNVWLIKVLPWKI